jgi:hypothetical protein
LALTQAEYLSPLGPCYVLNQWLNQYAAQFGFNRPYDKYVGGVAAEPWHLSYHLISKAMMNQFKLADLRDALINAQVSGLEIILLKLEAIYSRFILNQG